MARATKTQSHEVWEAVGAGAVWVTLTDDRGRESQRQVGGPGGAARVRVKVEDREAMEYASPGRNPFESGRLRRVDPDAPAQQVAKTDAELIESLSSGSLEADLMAESEFNIRRLKVLAETLESSSVSVAHLHTINRVITARWPQPEPPADQLAAANER